MKDLDVHLNPSEPAPRAQSGEAGVLAMFRRVKAKQDKEKGDGVQ